MICCDIIYVLSRQNYHWLVYLRLNNENGNLENNLLNTKKTKSMLESSIATAILTCLLCSFAKTAMIFVPVAAFNLKPNWFLWVLKKPKQIKYQYSHSKSLIYAKYIPTYHLKHMEGEMANTYISCFGWYIVLFEKIVYWGIP